MLVFYFVSKYVRDTVQALYQLHYLLFIYLFIMIFTYTDLEAMLSNKKSVPGRLKRPGTIILPNDHEIFCY